MSVPTPASAVPPARPVEMASEMAPRPAPPARKGGRVGLLVLLAGLALPAAAGVFLAVNPPARGRVQKLVRKAWEKVGGGHEVGPAAVPIPHVAPRTSWRGVVSVNAEQAKALGLEVVEARPQTEPNRIDINGTTAYDPNAQTQIRPKFSGLIDRVYVGLGADVEAGDPLVDLFSPDLAEAKFSFEKKVAQHEYDRTEAARARNLLETKSISEKEYLSRVNDEKRSAAEAKLAKDELLVYGLTEAEIAAIPKEDGTRKAKMTLRAPATGVVIRRDVVQGNRYDVADVLLVIAPLDHFWVWGSVYPDDASRVKLGQVWVVSCPFAGETHRRVVETIASEIDKETKTLRIGTRIGNENGRIKAEMQVRGYLEIPPFADRTVVPRTAMVSTDGADYLFVRREGSGGDFERRKVRVVQEHHDTIVVAEGLKAGEFVAARGSLVLAQMYEDALASEPDGAP